MNTFDLDLIAKMLDDAALTADIGDGIWSAESIREQAALLRTYSPQPAPQPVEAEGRDYDAGAMRRACADDYLQVALDAYQDVFDGMPGSHAKAMASAILAISSPQTAPVPVDGETVGWECYACKTVFVGTGGARCEKCGNYSGTLVTLPADTTPPPEQPAILVLNNAGNEAAISQRDDGKWEFSKGWVKVVWPEQPAIDLEQFRPAVDAVKRYGDRLNAEGALLPEQYDDWMEKADHLLAIINGAKARRVEGDDHE